MSVAATFVAMCIFNLSGAINAALYRFARPGLFETDEGGAGPGQAINLPILLPFGANHADPVSLQLETYGHGSANAFAD